MSSVRFTTAAEARAFALAGRRAYLTLADLPLMWFNYRISCGPVDRATGTVNRDTRFVATYGSPENIENSSEWNFTYLGFIHRNAFFYSENKTQIDRDAPCVKAFSCFWDAIMNDHLPTGFDVLYEKTKPLFPRRPKPHQKPL